MDSFFYTVCDINIGGVDILCKEIGIVVEEKAETIVAKFVNVDFNVEIEKNKIVFFDPEFTGDGFDNKVCNRCNRYLPTECFSKNQSGKDNRTVRRPSCNECRSKIDGVGVSSKVYKEWLEKKPEFVIWECPICKKKTIPGLTSKVVLDHNHNTGQPRAWICDSCNTGLGRFKDDIKTMQNAIKYLKKNK